MGDTSIAWTSKSWNPVRGCRRVSEGCRNCYAEKIAARFSGEGQRFHGIAKRRPARWTGAGRFVPEKLDEPMRWREPARVFVNSMSDLFFEEFTFDEIAAVFGIMAACPRHTFQVLTKRPARARQFFEWYARPPMNGDDALDACEIAENFLTEKMANRHENAIAVMEEYPAWPLPNVHLGVSVEDQATADERIPILLRCPAALRWISLEPQLADVDLLPFLKATLVTRDGRRLQHPDPGATTEGGAWDTSRLGWVVQGGESGPVARPFDLAWARKTRDQCRAAGTSYFLKQLGSRPVVRSFPEHAESSPFYVKDRGGKRPSEWPEDLRVQEFPEVRG